MRPINLRAYCCDSSLLKERNIAECRHTNYNVAGRGVLVRVDIVEDKRRAVRVVRVVVDDLVEMQRRRAKFRKAIELKGEVHTPD